MEELFKVVGTPELLVPLPFKLEVLFVLLFPVWLAAKRFVLLPFWLIGLVPFWLTGLLPFWLTGLVPFWLVFEGLIELVPL